MMKIFIRNAMMHHENIVCPNAASGSMLRAGTGIFNLMKKLLAILTFALCLLGASVWADDPVPLGRDATAEDVSAFFKKVSERPIAAEIEAGPNGAFGASGEAIEQEKKQASALMQGASSKALLEAFGSYIDAFNRGDFKPSPGQQRTPDIYNWIIAPIFEDALKSGATEADIPDLLSSTSVPGGLGIAPGPDVVFHHPAWCNSPAATTTLREILKNLQGAPPEYIGQNSVLEVANLNHDPAIQALLQDTLAQACHSAASPPCYLLAVFDAINHSKNPSISALMPDVVAALAKYAPSPNDPYAPRIYQERTGRVSHLILKGSPPLQNPDFVANATVCLTPPNRLFNALYASDVSLALARLSGSTATPSQATPDNSTHPEKPGDSTTLTPSPSSLTTTAQSPASPPTTNSSADDSSGVERPSLSSNSTEEEVAAVVTAALNDILARGLTNQEQEQELPSVESRLSQVKIKILLDLWKEVPVLFLGVSLDGKDHSDADWLSYKLKSQILEEAIRRYATVADAPDLIASKTLVGCRIANLLMIKHPAWSNSDVATRVLTDELKSIQTEPPTMLTALEYSPQSRQSVYTANSILQVADHSNNSAVVSLLKETMDQAISGSNPSPFFLLQALNTAAESENSEIHAELPGLIARIAKLQHKDYDGAAVRGFVEDPNKTFGTAEDLICGEIASNVSEVVQKNPSYLRNPDFISNATACLKASNNYQLHFPLEFALLGDSTAFGDILEKYYAFTSKQATGNEEQGQRQFNKYQADDVKKWLISTIVYHGNGNKDQDIQDHYHDAIYENGQWVLTMPGYVAPAPPQPVADSAPVTPAAPTQGTSSAASAPMALPQSTSPSLALATGTASAPVAQKIPVSVTVTSRAPIEQLDSSGHDIRVAIAVVGTTYTVLRVDGDQLLLKGNDGTQYRLSISATNYEASQK